ncbi:MAG: hypothetical protein ACK4RW_03415 [Rehaibacterium terrae]
MTVLRRPDRTCRFVFVMDPFPSLNLATETSLLLMQELLDRGHAPLWAEMHDVTLEDGVPRLRARPVLSVAPFSLGPVEPLGGDDIDALLIRKDPPFDGNYLHLTQMLDRLPPRVLQVNPARALREFNEKLLATRFAEFAPPSRVTMDAGRLLDFVREHGTVVVKPLDDCSGRGIAVVEHVAAGLHARVQALLRDAHGAPRYVQAQPFLPAIAQGDKRVFLVDGEVAGIVNRVPAPGRWLGNIHQGAQVEAAALSLREAACIEALRPFLREHGLLLVGADFIGGWLTELNITSPSAVRQINAVSGARVERTIVDALLREVVARQVAAAA